MLLTKTPQKVRIVKPEFPFANNTEGIRSDRATILGKERLNFNSKQ